MREYILDYAKAMENEKVTGILKAEKKIHGSMQAVCFY